MSDQLVGICGALSPGILGSNPQICDLPALHAGWHGADNVTPAGWPSTRTSWVNETDWPAELAALRQQLDEARAERDTLASMLASCEERLGRVDEKVRAVEADRDRLLVVYRAAEAWAGTIRLLVEIDGDHLSQPSRDLLAALDDYWTQASDGDTPGELVPGEGEQVLPVDAAS